LSQPSPWQAAWRASADAPSAAASRLYRPAAAGPARCRPAAGVRCAAPNPRQAQASGKRSSEVPAAAAVLFEAVGDAALGQVVGGHLDQDLVACEHADTILSHAAGSMSDDLVFVFELHPEHRVGQQFRDGARELEDFFLRHSLPLVCVDFRSAGPELRGTYMIVASL